MGMENFGGSLGRTARDLLQNWKEWDYGMTENLRKKKNVSRRICCRSFLIRDSALTVDVANSPYNRISSISHPCILLGSRDYFPTELYPWFPS